MNVKYQIFVSSTYEDLKNERNEVIKACLNMGHIPVGMEMFNAADEEQWAVITRTIDQCDYYVVIVAHRYGSTVDGISFTEKEYDYAVAQSVPVLGFIIAEDAPWPNTKKDEQPDTLDALKRFKAKVKQKMVRLWRDKSELQAHFAVSLAQSLNLNPRRGWMRVPLAADADVAQSISALAESVAKLEKSSDHRQAGSKELEFGARRIIDMLSKRRWRLGNRDLYGYHVFIDICEVIGSGRKSVEHIATQMDTSVIDLTRFLNRMELLGALTQSLDRYELSNIGRQMYKILLAEREARLDRLDSLD